MSAIGSINRLFDSLPRTRITVAGREAPAFRCCGVAGFYVALIIVAAGTLLTGRSLAVAALVSAVAAGSFFVWAFFRRWVSGGEKLVLLEHVWFALALVGGALWLVHQPVLPYLDVMSPALAVFLFAGRIGCTMAGCCHGHPSSVGIIYGENAVADGFPMEFAGIRLFPVQAIEALFLLFIGLSGLAALPFARQGEGLIWFLIAYGVTRFGLEGLRADPRPHFLGWSQSRWMCVGQAVAAIGLSESGHTGLAVWAVLALILPAVVIWKAISERRGGRRRLLAAEHILELRDFAMRDVEARAIHGPRLRASSRGVGLAVSLDPGAAPALAHVSLSLTRGHGDLRLLCSLACQSFPGLRPEVTRYTLGRVLHLAVPLPLELGSLSVPASEALALQAYGAAVRLAQSDAAPPTSRAGELRVFVRETERPVARPMAEPEEAPAEDLHPRPKRPWYFGLSGSERE